MKSIESYTDLNYIKILSSGDKFSAIEELALVFKNSSVCSDLDSLISALKEREEIMSTGIGFGIAIPHAKIPCVSNIAFAVGVSKSGIDFDSMDGKPVHLIILVAAGAEQHKDYLSLLSSVMALLKKDGIKEKIINAKSTEDIFSIITEDI